MSAIQFNTDKNLEIKSQQKPTPKADEKKEYTPEEIEDLARVTMEGLGWGEAYKKKEEKPSPKEGEKAISTPENDPDKKKEEKSPEKPAETPATRKPKQPKTEGVAESVATAIREGNERLIEKLSDSNRPSHQAPTASEAPQTDEEREQLEVFSEMAKLPGIDPELPKKFERFFRIQAGYQVKWEKDNPGKDFDPDAEEHEDWYSDHQPTYDERKYDDARIKLRVDKTVAEREAQTQHQTVLKSAIQSAETEIESVTEALETDIKAKMDELFGENQILDEPGPITNQLKSVTDDLAHKITTATLLTTPGAGVAFNPNDPAHVAIRQEVIDANNDISAMTEAEQRQFVTKVLGKKSRLLSRKFVPMEEYQKLSAADRGKYWNVAVEPSLVAKLLTVKAKTGMEAWIDQLCNQVGRKKSDSVASQSTREAKQETAVPASASAAKPSPPSLAPGASDVTSGAPGKQKGENTWESIATSAF